MEACATYLDVGVAPVAPLVSYCSLARTIDAIKVGDWLLHEHHMEWVALHQFAIDNLWRDGAEEALWVLGFLDGDSRSLRESGTRPVLHFAGLPAPEVNTGAVAPDDSTRIGDLVYRRWDVVVEHEGEHHQVDRAQYVKDIDRYASMRRGSTAVRAGVGRGRREAGVAEGRFSTPPTATHRRPPPSDLHAPPPRRSRRHAR